MTDTVPESVGEVAVAAAHALEGCGVPYALGGALAYNYYGVPRATGDVDFNVFVSDQEAERVLECLDGQGFSLGEDAQGLVRRTGQLRAKLAGRFVDLFFAHHAFHESCRERTALLPFGSTILPVLSAEDVVVFKALFNRSRDWGDIERVLGTQGARFDIEYVRRWLDDMLGAGSSERGRLDALHAAAVGG